MHSGKIISAKIHTAHIFSTKNIYVQKPKHSLHIFTHKFLAFILLFVLIALSGCGENVKKLPPVQLSGKNYPSSGVLVYGAETLEGKPKGKETITFKTQNGVMCVKSSVMLAEVCVEKDTFAPVSVNATYKVGNAPSYVKITFSNDKIMETIARNGKEKQYTFRNENPLYVDDILDFSMQGFDFSQKEGYLIDFFPYTSVKYPCKVENLGKTTIKYDGKDTEVYELLLDFGKKQRFLYFLTTPQHLLVRREENNLIYVLKFHQFSE
jgi:hypothetical protein